ncbi:hypothetical protein LguiB_034575 [Lonicera macranthoides]
MGDSFTIQISSNLVKQLADEGEQFKKKARKPKTKVPRQPQTKPQPKKQSPKDESEPFERPGGTGWPLQPPLFLPVPPPQYSASAELEAIRSVLQESEKVMEKLQKREKEMVQEVTERAKDLHEKEFKIPERKPMPCLGEKDACTECYKEHLKDPLKCAHLVNSFADCVRRARQVMSVSTDK